MIITKPTLVLDVDGVLADFTGATLEFIERNYGVYSSDPLTDWDFMDAPSLRPYRRVAKGHWETPGFCRGLQPLPGTVDTVAAIRRVADVKFATSPMGSNPSWIQERNAWLAEHFGADPLATDIRHTTKKSEVKGHVFVDDKFENVEEYQLAHPDSLVFLRTHSYNEASPWQGRRCDNLETILNVMESLWKAYN